MIYLYRIGSNLENPKAITRGWIRCCWTILQLWSNNCLNLLNTDFHNIFIVFKIEFHTILIQYLMQSHNKSLIPGNAQCRYCVWPLCLYVPFKNCCIHCISFLIGQKIKYGHVSPFCHNLWIQPIHLPSRDLLPMVTDWHLSFQWMIIINYDTTGNGLLRISAHSQQASRRQFQSYDELGQSSLELANLSKSFLGIHVFHTSAFNINMWLSSLEIFSSSKFQTIPWTGLFI